MTCRKVEEVLGCFVAEDGTKQTVIIHNVTDADGVVIATLFLDSAHAPVAGATAETVTPGACPVPQPIVEWVRYCETVDDEQVEFWCVITTTFDAACQPIVPPTLSFYELDKQTVYEPVGTPEPCAECLPEEDAGVLTDWTALRASAAVKKEAEVAARN